MCESQPREVWRSSRDLISVPSDKEEATSRVSKKINKTGALQYLHSQDAGEDGRERMRCSSVVVQRV